MIGRPDDWTRGTAGKLAAGKSVGAEQGQRSAVVTLGDFAAEGAGGIQDGRAEIRGAAGRGSLQELLDAVQAEFLGGMFVVTLAGDHSAGNQQQRGIFLKAYGGSIASGVGEESQREASRTEFDDAGMVAEQSWGVSGVGVAERAELLVVAGDESGTGVDAFAGVDKAAIDAKTELRHGIRFVEIRGREQLRSDVAKNMLRGCEDGTIVRAESGHVEQTKQNALGTDTQGVVEISGDALAHELSRDFCALDLRKYRRDRLGWRGSYVLRVKEGVHGGQAQRRN